MTADYDVVVVGVDGAERRLRRAGAKSVAVGEDTDDVSAAPDLFVEPLLGVVGPDLAPDLFGERGEREQVGTSCFEMISNFG